MDTLADADAGRVPDSVFRGQGVSVWLGPDTIDAVVVRNSAPWFSARQVAFTKKEWREFLVAVRNGEYDV